MLGFLELKLKISSGPTVRLFGCLIWHQNLSPRSQVSTKHYAHATFCLHLHFVYIDCHKL